MEMKKWKQFAAVLLSAAMVLTGFPVQTASAQPGNGPSEDSTGAYTQYHIYTEADLVSALDGTAAIDGEVTALPVIMENDIALTAPLVVNAEVALDLNGKTLSADASFVETAEKKLTLTVEKEKSLTLRGEGILSLNLVNKGTFFQRGGSLTVKPMYGTALINEVGAEAAFDDILLCRPYRDDGELTLLSNAGTVTLNQYSAGSYRGNEWMEIRNGQGGVMNIWGDAGSVMVSLKNNGTLLIGGEIKKVYNEGQDALTELTDDADVNELYTYNGGDVQMNDGKVGTLELDEQISVSQGSTAPGGTFTLAGGFVGQISYVSNRPKLIGGTVASPEWKEYSMKQDAAVLRYEKAADGIYEVSCNTAEYVTLDEYGNNVTVPARQHQEGRNAETGEPELVEVPATSIVNGAVNDCAEIDSVSPNAIAVSGNKALVEALRNAPADGTLTRFYTSSVYDMAAISENVVIRTGQRIELNLSKRIVFAPEATLTIEEGAAFTVKSDDQGYGFANTKNKDAFLMNRGSFHMENAMIYLKEAARGFVNEGEKAELSLDNAVIVMQSSVSSDAVAIVNTKGNVQFCNNAGVGMSASGLCEGRCILCLYRNQINHNARYFGYPLCDCI